MERLIDGQRRPRREYSGDFETLLFAYTRGPGASVAGIALSHGLHPYMVHRWLREERLTGTHVKQQPPGFVARANPQTRTPANQPASPEIRHEPKSTTCACGCQMMRIGEDVAEKLYYVRSVFTVERHIRGKWACAKCETIQQVPFHPHVIDKGIRVCCLKRTWSASHAPTRSPHEPGSSGLPEGAAAEAPSGST
jgi:transposase-like protein